MAVAIKNRGYTHIEIYNGGIKDWTNAGHKIESVAPLPKYKGKFISCEELLNIMDIADKNGCQDDRHRPVLTILDLRTENYLKTDPSVPAIKTGCKTITCLLDDLIRPDIRKQIPHDSPVVIVTETGNRDIYAMQYLSQFGYRNIRGLDFGMRGWIKLNYPVETH